MSTAIDDAQVGARLHRDIYPAKVFAPDVATHERIGRVFITDTHVVVFAADGNNVPSEFFRARITGAVPERDRGTGQKGFQLETESGPVYIERAGGCGCGSSLKALDGPVAW